MIYKSLTYEPITKVFNENSCLIKDIEIPNIDVTEITSIRIKNENTSINYINNNKIETVNFNVFYIPKNNQEGIKLFAEAKKIVESVKNKDFEGSPAVINTFSNSQALDTITVNDCIPKTVTIQLNKNNENEDSCIVISFNLVGQLSRNF